MKLHEVLEIAIRAHEKIENGDPDDPDVNPPWFRPIVYRDTGIAYMLKEGLVYCVPSSTGGTPGITFDARLLMSEWEVVDPDVVLSNRDSLFENKNIMNTEDSVELDAESQNLLFDNLHNLHL